MSPLQLLSGAAARGLDVLAVTDHDRLEGALECASLAAADSSLPRVIVGEEMASRQGDIVGLFLSREIPGGLDVWETIALIRDQGGLVYLPHPFDRFRRATMDSAVVEEVANLVDVVEVANGRALTTSANPLALDLAARHGKRLGAGSDAHFPGELGRCYLELPTGPGTLAAPKPSAVAGLPTASDRDGFLDALRRARPRAPSPAVGMARSWLFCLSTGALMALRRSAVSGRKPRG